LRDIASESTDHEELEVEQVLEFLIEEEKEKV